MLEFFAFSIFTFLIYSTTREFVVSTRWLTLVQLFDFFALTLFLMMIGIVVAVIAVWVGDRTIVRKYK